MESGRRILEGSFVCSYEGEELKQSQLDTRDQTYLFELRPPREGYDGLYVDGMRSSHVSRYINHDEQGCLLPVVGIGACGYVAKPVVRWRGPVLKRSRAHHIDSDDEPRIQFYAARNIALGEELSFDYGEVCPCAHRPRALSRPPSPRPSPPRSSDRRTARTSRARTRRPRFSSSRAARRLASATRRGRAKRAARELIGGLFRRPSRWHARALMCP